MAGYDRKSVALSHDAQSEVTFSIEVDITGTGLWRRYVALEVLPGNERQFEFPEAFAAYWVRVVVDRDCVASARFEYR